MQLSDITDRYSNQAPWKLFTLRRLQESNSWRGHSKAEVSTALKEGTFNRMDSYYSANKAHNNALPITYCRTYFAINSFIPFITFLFNVGGNFLFASKTMITKKE